MEHISSVWVSSSRSLHLGLQGAGPAALPRGRADEALRPRLKTAHFDLQQALMGPTPNKVEELIARKPSNQGKNAASKQ